jgi:hypothetical protein
MALRSALASLVLANGLAQTQAHNIYTGLYGKYGTACCDNSDCRPARYRKTPAGVQMLVDREWISVRLDAIQYRLLMGDTGDAYTRSARVRAEDCRGRRAG